MKFTHGISDESSQDKSLYIEELFFTYFDELCFYSYSYVADIDVAKDIVQEAFLSLWVNIENYTPTRAILYTIVKNKAIDYLRQQDRSRHISESQIYQKNLDEYIGELIINQEDYLTLSDLSAEIQKSTKKLPPQCQKIFRMSRFQQMKNKEIADNLNISIKAVEKQITKALHIIYTHLLKKGLLFILWLLLYFF